MSSRTRVMIFILLYRHSYPQTDSRACSHLSHPGSPLVISTPRCSVCLRYHSLRGSPQPVCSQRHSGRRTLEFGLYFDKVCIAHRHKTWIKLSRSVQGHINHYYIQPFFLFLKLIKTTSCKYHFITISYLSYTCSNVFYSF